jgi:hypothetical protein
VISKNQFSIYLTRGNPASKLWVGGYDPEHLIAQTGDTNSSLAESRIKWVKISTTDFWSRIVLNATLDGKPIELSNFVQVLFDTSTYKTLLPKKDFLSFSNLLSA